MDDDDRIILTSELEDLKETVEGLNEALQHNHNDFAYDYIKGLGN